MEKFTKKQINQFKKDIQKERLKLFKKDDDLVFNSPEYQFRKNRIKKEIMK